MSEETMTISVKEYDRLLNCQRKLACLQSAGVDNWSGYSYAMEEFYKEEEDEE